MLGSDNLSADETSLPPPAPQLKSLGPDSRQKLSGVKYDWKTGKYLSFIKLSKDGSSCRLGQYATEEQAAVAHDMHAIKIYGLLADEVLNFQYQYETDVNPETSKNILRLKLSGAVVAIECDDEVEKETFAARSGQTAENALINTTDSSVTIGSAEAEAVDSLLCSPPGTAAILPGKADVNRRWPERLTSSFYPTAAFAYEVTFTHQSSLGLQLRPLMLTYSLAGGKRTLGCCVVIDASLSPSPQVQAGDILVSVNGQSLIGAQPQASSDQRESQRDSSGGFSFDASVKAISQAAAPRTIRFLRTAGLSVNQQLSPAEASLLVYDHHPVAKYTVEQSSVPGGNPHQAMIYIDNQVEFSIESSHHLLILCYSPHYRAQCDHHHQS